MSAHTPTEPGNVTCPTCDGVGGTWGSGGDWDEPWFYECVTCEGSGEVDEDRASEAIDAGQVCDADTPLYDDDVPDESWQDFYR